ncbi:MAG: MgtC/SapB family protein [Pirellulaceae bacterium]
MFEGFGGILDLSLRMVAAVLLGGVVGIERRIHGRWADMRTHMLVALGAATFVVLALSTVTNGEERDPSTIIQGIAAGIGFLGAGTILKLTDQMEVKGLTTASAIWLSAAVGTAAGLAQYQVAVVATVVSLIVLLCFRPIEKRFEAPEERHD